MSHMTESPIAMALVGLLGPLSLIAGYLFFRWVSKQEKNASTKKTEHQHRPEGEGALSVEPNGGDAQHEHDHHGSSAARS